MARSVIGEGDGTLTGTSRNLRRINTREGEQRGSGSFPFPTPNTCLKPALHR